jgi:hypothetical protein
VRFLNGKDEITNGSKSSGKMEAGTQSHCGKQGRGGSAVVHFSRRLPELCEQRFGLLQVFGVKPFGEPAVDLGQQLSGLWLLPSPLPQAA